MSGESLRNEENVPDFFQSMLMATCTAVYIIFVEDLPSRVVDVLQSIVPVTFHGVTVGVTFCVVPRTVTFPLSSSL